LKVDGKWVDIIARDPSQHFRVALEQQVRQIALWQTAITWLLPRYGTQNPKTGQLEYPMGQHDLGITDVPGLLDRLRADVVKGATKARRANQVRASFNRLIDNYHRTEAAGWMEEFFVDWDASPAGKLVSVADNAATTSILTLAPAYDLVRWLTAVPGTGVTGVRGMLSSVVEMLLHPRKFDAEYRALGVVQSEYTDWTLHADSVFMDVARKGVRNVGLALGRFTERRSQFTIARMHDAWLTALNDRAKAIRVSDEEYLKQILRLTDADISAIGAGKMTPALRSKALQNAVNSLAGLPEFAWNKGRAQNSPWGRFFFRFMSVVNANVRVSAALTDGVRTNIQTALDSTKSMSTRRQAAGAVVSLGFKLLGFVAALAGNGFVQKYIRRALLGRPILDAEDSDSWIGQLWEAILEGGTFGPFYRVFEAAKYSNWNLYEVGARLSWPLSVAADLGMAFIGAGQYRESPWADRLKQLGVRYLPVYKAAHNWVGRVEAPTREDYYRVHGLVRKWLKDRGEEPQYGTAEARNLRYYRLFEAIRDDDPDAIAEALAAVKNWAKNEQKWESEQARRNLQSSLNARRPINLKPERKQEFLAGLSEPDRILAESEDRRYSAYVTRLTQRPGVPIRAERPQRPQGPTRGGDWYAAD